MITLTREAKFTLSRDVRHKYAEPHEATAMDWGRPTCLIPSKIMHCEINIAFAYDDESRVIAGAVINSIRKLLGAATSPPNGADNG